jgi:hypothetical protein
MLNAKLTMEFCFGAEVVAGVFAGLPGLLATTTNTAARPNVAAHLASAESVLYGGVKGMPEPKA